MVLDSRPRSVTPMATATAGPVAIGDLLVREGLVTREQLKHAQGEARGNGNGLAWNLVKMGVVQEVELTKLLGRVYKVPAVDLTRFEVDPRILRLLPPDVATRHLVLPLKREGRTLTVAMADPGNLTLLEDLKFITRYDVFPVLAGEFTLRTLIERHYDSSDQQLRDLLKDVEGLADDVEVVEEQEDEAATQAQIDDAPVVKLINGLLTDAVRRGASDIHIEPFEHEMRV